MATSTAAACELMLQRRTVSPLGTRHTANLPHREAVLRLGALVLLLIALATMAIARCS